VDEVLFQAKVHPLCISTGLTDQQIEAIHKAIHLVLETAITKEANYRDFPKSFLIHARQWDTSPYNDLETHKFCPRCGEKIDIIVVGGRTSYYCPKEQVIQA
jgi:formamidopyrimidine-DNA glycosylase